MKERGVATGRAPLPRELHAHLPKVEVQEVLRLVGHVAAKVAADNAVPRRAILLVELLLDVWTKMHASERV